MKSRKKLINAYPVDELTMSEFVFGEAAGVPKIIRFMNDWSAAIDKIGTILVVRYESLHSMTGRTLAAALGFIGEAATPAEIDECVRFASIENMRARER